jgi:hypothetical protein
VKWRPLYTYPEGRPEALGVFLCRAAPAVVQCTSASVTAIRCISVALLSRHRYCYTLAS